MKKYAIIRGVKNHGSEIENGMNSPAIVARTRCVAIFGSPARRGACFDLRAVKTKFGAQWDSNDMLSRCRKAVSVMDD